MFVELEPQEHEINQHVSLEEATSFGIDVGPARRIPRVFFCPDYLPNTIDIHRLRP
jgi:hypothetical protein